MVKVWNRTLIACVATSITLTAFSLGFWLGGSYVEHTKDHSSSSTEHMVFYNRADAAYAKRHGIFKPVAGQKCSDTGKVWFKLEEGKLICAHVFFGNEKGQHL